MSVATDAFAAALERLAVADVPPAQRPAYDVFGVPPAQGLASLATGFACPALGALPRSGRIAAAAAALHAGVATSEELTALALAEIERRNDELGAFVEVAAERALAEARARDREPRRGPLHGIPVSVKDVFDVAGLHTRAGSRAYDVLATEDAEPVALLRAPAP